MLTTVVVFTCTSVRAYQLANPGQVPCSFHTFTLDAEPVPVLYEQQI